jgi:hypothetical protein
MATSALHLLRTTGGFTVDLNDGAKTFPTEGFAVSVNPERTRVIEGTVDSVTLHQYGRDNRDLLSTPGKVFGGWLDTESGKTYLDVVTLFDSKEEALDLAVEHGELAIFDLGSGQEIRTGLVK